MRTTDVELICQTYDDAINKRKAIMSLSKLLSVSPDEIIEKLQQNGRTIAQAEPKKKTIKEPEKKEVEKVIKENPIQSVAPISPTLPMPEIVQDILFREFSHLEQRIGELTAELDTTKEQYCAVKKFLFGD